MRLIFFITITGFLIAAIPAHGDPTRPPTPAEIQAWQAGRTADDPKAEWQLQSVLIADTRRVAVINGQRYRTGDRVGPARVVAIEPGQVMLEHDGDRFSLTIASRTQPVRRTPN